jgi:hypothetical protein
MPPINNTPIQEQLGYDAVVEMDTLFDEAEAIERAITDRLGPLENWDETTHRPVELDQLQQMAIQIRTLARIVKHLSIVLDGGTVRDGLTPTPIQIDPAQEIIP